MLRNPSVRNLAAAMGLQVLLSLSCAGATEAAEAAPDRVSVILAQMKAASGGNLWDSIQTLHTVAVAQNGGEEEQREYWEDVQTGRNRLRVSLRHSIRQTGYDGVTPWIQGRSGLAYTFGDLDSRLGAADEAFRTSRGWWFPERFAATIAYLTQAQQLGQTFDVLSITPEGGRPFQAWIDRKTHLLARIVERQAQGVLSTQFSDYRDVRGLKLPFKIVYGDGANGTDAVIERVQSIDLNMPVPDRIYAVPPRSPSDIEFPEGTDSVEIPFHIARNNRILVPVTIDGVKLEAWFDSGGSLFLQPDTVAKLKAHAYGQHSLTGGGEGGDVAGIGEIGAISIGAAKIRALSFHQFAFYPDDPDEAMIGLEVLQRFVVRLDFDRDIMTLTRPEAFEYRGKGEVVPFHFQDNQPEVTGSLDGIAGRFTMDTGDTGSLLLIAPFARRYGLKARYQADIPYDGISVGVTKGVWARKRVHMLALNGADGRPVAEVHDPVTRISLQQSGFDANRYVDANIGLGVLRKFNIIFDYTHRRIILEPNSLYNEPDIYNRTGFKLTQNRRDWTISTIFPHCPAEEAGLRLGDAIETIDGRSMEEFRQPELDRLLKGAVGDKLSLVARRADTWHRLTITLRDCF